jgi:hypothetical protein
VHEVDGALRRAEAALGVGLAGLQAAQALRDRVAADAGHAAQLLHHILQCTKKTAPLAI